MAKRISIINFKGGVGKTTLAFHLGTGLAWYHDARVLLVDMDHQSSLSVVCLRAEQWAEKARDGLTVDAIFQPLVSTNATFPGDAIIAKSPLGMADYAPYRYDVDHHDYANLDIVPASLGLDDTEINLTASRIGGPTESDWDKRTCMCRWLEETGVDGEYDYIIFDCPPATKVVAQNAIAASHGYIIPVVPEAMMVRGTQHLRELLRTGIDSHLKKLADDESVEQRAMYVRDSRLFGLAVTRFYRRTNDHTWHLDSLKRHWGENLLEPVIALGVGVSEALTDGRPVFDKYGPSWGRNIRDRGIDRCYKELTAEIKRRVDDA